MCLNNTSGQACNLCAPGFYGDAIKLKDCQSWLNTKNIFNILFDLQVNLTSFQVVCVTTLEPNIATHLSEHVIVIQM